MAKKIRGKSHRRNPVATSPLLRKGGAHVKSASAERNQARQGLKRQLRREDISWPGPGEGREDWNSPDRNKNTGFPPVHSRRFFPKKAAGMDRRSCFRPA